VLWEAQFGDFVNGAQPIIDQILMAAESKWRYANGMVLLLPHGYEGQGPEHSNAYIERSSRSVPKTTCRSRSRARPAVFHLIRRQIHRKFRKPLILMMPKSLLRKEGAMSDIAELTDGTFQTVIDDPAMGAADRDKVRRVLLCAGKVYYTLRDGRTAAERDGDIAIVRVEQLYPFPRRNWLPCSRAIAQAGSLLGSGRTQEPRRLELRRAAPACLLPDTILTYVGRDEAASPATGSAKQHVQEERELVTAALDLPAKKTQQLRRSFNPAPSPPRPIQRRCRVSRMKAEFSR